MPCRKSTANRYRVRWNVLITRLALMLLIGSLTAGAARWALPGAQYHRPGTAAPATSTVVVQPGDSLWSIAGRAAGPGKDARPVVESIRQLNGLESSVIQPGANLRIPILGEGQRVAVARRGQTDTRRKS